MVKHMLVHFLQRESCNHTLSLCIMETQGLEHGNSETIEGLPALADDREPDALESNTGLGVDPAHPFSLGLLQVVQGSTQLELFLALFCIALACFVGWVHNTHHFSASFPYQSSSQPSLGPPYRPHTLQAFWFYWILPKLSMVLSFPLYRRETGDQGFTIPSDGGGIQTQV